MHKLTEVTIAATSPVARTVTVIHSVTIFRMTSCLLRNVVRDKTDSEFDQVLLGKCLGKGMPRPSAFTAFHVCQKLLAYC